LEDHSPAPGRFHFYPYEWSFSQLKDAAVATLAIQKQAMGHGMSLKDATASTFNLTPATAVDRHAFLRAL